MTTEPLLSPARQPKTPDEALRPRTLAEFVGRAAVLGTDLEKNYT